MKNMMSALMILVMALSATSALTPKTPAFPVVSAQADGGADYAIITTNAILANSVNLGKFIMLKQAFGYSVRVVTETDFEALSGQAPNGRAEKIRQWLKDNYQAMGIKYVLLIGNPDPELDDIPMKRFWPGYDWPNEVQRDYPTDMYYANLNCNWDLDGDQIYGEFKSISSPVKPAILLNKDTFSIIWDGLIEPHYSEAYNFRIFHNNGARLKIDGNVIIDDWNLESTAHFSAVKTIDMSAGFHSIEVSYRKDTGDALITLERSSPHETSGWDFGFQNSLYHRNDYTLALEPGLEANYYENMDFTDLAWSLFPIVDDTVNFAWCTGDRGPGGIDCHADVYVGRIPVYNNGYAQFDSILQKMIDYETDQGDVSWRKKVLLPAEVDDPVMQAIKTDIADPSGFASFRISDTSPSEATLTPKKNVEDEWKKGYGVVTWFAHGSARDAEHVFDSTQCSSLDDSKPSFVCAVSCNNACPEDSENLAYSLLKHGAVSIIAATNVSWLGWSDPKSLGWSISSLNNEHLGYFYTKYLIQDGETAGEALFRTKGMCPLDPACCAGGDYENACAFNLYGDPACSLFGFASVPLPLIFFNFNPNPMVVHAFSELKGILKLPDGTPVVHCPVEITCWDAEAETKELYTYAMLQTDNNGFFSTTVKGVAKTGFYGFEALYLFNEKYAAATADAFLNVTSEWESQVPEMPAMIFFNFVPNPAKVVPDSEQGPYARLMGIMVDSSGAPLCDAPMKVFCSYDDGKEWDGPLGFLDIVETDSNGIFDAKVWVGGVGGRNGTLYLVESEFYDYYGMVSSTSYLMDILGTTPKICKPVLLYMDRRTWSMWPSFFGSLDLRQWREIHLEFSGDLSVYGVKTDSLVLNDTLHVNASLISIEDYNLNGIPDLTIKLDRTMVSQFLLAQNTTRGNVSLTLAGRLYNGTIFEQSFVVTVHMPGDLNMDGKVDISDIAVASSAFGSYPGLARWNPIPDENDDNRVDIQDIAISCSNYGKTYM